MLQGISTCNQTLPKITRRLQTAGFSTFRALATFLLTLLLCQTVVAESAAITSTDRIALGNQAVKQKNYTQAIDHYRKALSGTLPEGQSKALLNYNLGVAYYRTAQWSEAEAAYIQAAREAKLKALAFYNLGLVFRAKGDNKEAARWFEQVKYMPTASSSLKKLARTAVRQTAEKEEGLQQFARKTRRLIPEIYRPGKKQKHFWVDLSTLAGQDSNIYRAPGDSYVDLAQTGTPTVQPEEQSGTFSIVRLDSQVRWGTHEDAYFVLRYFLDGRLYHDSEFSNANEITQGLQFGGRLKRRKGSSVTRYNSYFEVSQHKREAYDPDTGDDQFLNGENISDRLTYVHLGPRLDYQRFKGPVGIGLKLDGGINRYEGSDPLIDYSHEQYKGTGSLIYRPFDNTRVALLYSHEIRNYTERPARDATGTRRLTNPNLEYIYRTAGLTAKQRLSAYFWFAVDYRFTLREDQFEGYDDYLRHSARLTLNLRSSKRLQARFGFTYRDYTFDNAFAFNLAAGGEKTLTTSYGFAKVDFAVTRHFSLSAEARFNQNESSDPRMEYSRNRAALGLRWTL